jgi:hypothetical protein
MSARESDSLSLRGAGTEPVRRRHQTFLSYFSSAIPRVHVHATQAAEAVSAERSRGVSRTKRAFKVTPVTEWSSLGQLLTAPIDSAVIVPKRYFKASNELIVLTLVVCWIVTLMYDPKLVMLHPARTFVSTFAAPRSVAMERVAAAVGDRRWQLANSRRFESRSRRLAT